MGIAKKNNAQIYKYNDLTPTQRLLVIVNLLQK